MEAQQTISSQLVSILEQEQASAEQGNISLQYQAPTQPKSRSPLAMAAPREAPSNTPPRPSTDKPPAILFAGACHPFRLYKGGFLPVQVPEGAAREDGALGMVIVGRGDGRKMRVLVYTVQKQEAVSIPITLEVKAVPQAGNYMSMQADDQTVWSLLLKTGPDLAKVAQAIALAKSAEWTPEHHPLVLQDASVGDAGEHEVADGDEVTVHCKGYLEGHDGRGCIGTELKLGAPKIDQTFVVGTGSAIAGWEQGVLGMRRGGVRWIVVPPHLAYGSAGDSEGIVPGDAVLIFELTLVDVVAAESGNGDEGPVPMVPLEGDRAVLSAIKSLRPPSETSEDANEWEEEGEGLAETPVVLVPSGNEGDGADNHGVEKGEEDQQGEEGGTEGDSAQVNGEEGSADDQDEMLKSRMAKLSEHGGPGLHGPGLHMLIGGRAAHGAQYAGHAGEHAHPLPVPHAYGPFPGGTLTGGAEVLDAVRGVGREQADVRARVAEMAGKLDALRGGVDLLVDEQRRAAAGRGGAADLLMGQVLVESVGKLVADNERLRADANALRESLEEARLVAQRAGDERRKLEEQVRTHAESGLSGAEVQAMREERERAEEALQRAEERTTALAQEARALRQERHEAEDRARLAEENLADEQAARARVEEERRKARRELAAQRDSLSAEMEEERAAQDRVLAELRETVRRLRVQGAGAREEELEEAERAAEARISQIAAEADERAADAARHAAKREEELRRELAETRARADTADAAAVDTAARQKREMAALESQVTELREEVARVQAAGKAREAELGAAAKARIEKLKETARQELPERLKEVASSAYFRLEEALSARVLETGGAKGLTPDEVLIMVLENLKAATLEATEDGLPTSAADSGTPATQGLPSAAETGSEGGSEVGTKAHDAGDTVTEEGGCLESGISGGDKVQMQKEHETDAYKEESEFANAGNHDAATNGATVVEAGVNGLAAAESPLDTGLDAEEDTLPADGMSANDATTGQKMSEKNKKGKRGKRGKS